MTAGIGPYATERDTMDSPLGAAIRNDDSTTLGAHRAIQIAHLTHACQAAGVELGAYDERILAWLANQDPATVQVVIGLISRAHAAGLAQDRVTVWQQDVLDAADEYYWHDHESVDFHNTLMDAVKALHDNAPGGEV